MTAASTALEYIRRGWSVIPVSPPCLGSCGEDDCSCGKRPISDDWPALNIQAADVPRYFSRNTNIGVVLGDISGGLVDIDLDVPEAVALAPHFLERTQEFGRPGSRRSHWLYYARGARTEKFQQQLGAGKLAMLVELRANKTSESGQGLQTVFPGSTHRSGESIEWEKDSAAEPLQVKPEQLRRDVARLSTAVLLVRLGWQHDQAVAIGRSPSPGALRELDGAVYDRIARWVGLPKREAAPPPRAPLPPTDNRLKRAAAYLAKVDGALSGSGGHQQAWKAALAVVRGFDLSEAEGYELLARDFNPRCSPPWSDRELAHKVKDAANNARIERGFLLRENRPNFTTGGGNNNRNGISQPAAAPDLTEPLPPAEWEPPLDFGVFDLPAFPVEVLPSSLGDFVQQLAVATQTPLDLGGMLVLAACAASCAKRLVVEVVPGYQEPVNLFTVAVLPPGERKSAVLRAVAAPLVEWEVDAAEQAKPAITRAAQRLIVSKKRLDAAVDRAAKAKSKEERKELELEIEDMSEQHASLQVPVEPRLLADDATPEALASLLAQHGGRIAVLSAEGGIFTMMAGKYSESPSLDVYLKAHSGDEIRVDRKGRPSERVSDPALTLGLAIQPAVLEALAETQMLRGTGLLARFLYALPTSMLGARKVDAPSVSDAVRSAYETAVRRLLLLQAAKKPLVMKLSPEAYVVWREFAEWVEPQLADFGDMESIRDWAGKLPGAVARIAGVLRILRILSLNKPSEDISISIYIERAEMLSAVALGKYFVPHAHAVFSSMGAANSNEEAAKHLVKCLRRKAWTSFSRRDVQQSVRRSSLFAEEGRLDRALQILEERGFIRPQPPSMRGAGRPPSPVYEVNPRWDRKTLPQNPLNPQNERDPGEDDD